MTTLTINKIKSPVNRMGGKAYLTKWLSSFISRHTLYCEPFAGGVKLLFSKEPSKIEIINDRDENVVNLYRCVKNDERRQKLINLLDETPYARSVFQAWKYGEEISVDDIEKAARYFYLCKASFAGDVERGGFGVPPKGTGRNPAITFRASIPGLVAVAGRLANVVIENLDYADCIQRYDSPGSLFYCDPPYFGAEHYYGSSFTQDDHHRLSELLHAVKGMVMISHYADPVYDELYNGWNKHIFESFKGCSKASSGESKPKTQEYLFTNFEPPLRNKMLTGF